MQIFFSKLFDQAIEPSRRDPGAAGFDLFTPIGLTIYPFHQVVVDTGIVLEMVFDQDESYYAQVFSKSSVATKRKLVVDAGVIDANFRGSIGVVLRNIGTETVRLAPGQPIAQLVFMKTHTPQLKEKDVILTDTDRGTRGFGEENWNTKPDLMEPIEK